MTLYDSIILGVIEGITEFLPVSSTAHLVLASQILEVEETPFLQSFNIVIQSAPILSVIIIFWSQLFSGFNLWSKLIVSFIPTGVVGLFLHDYLEALFVVDITVPLMFITGVAFILIEKFNSSAIYKSEVEISYKTAFGVGLFQALSILPGVSRSGATILGAMLLKMDRELAMRYSFLLAIPTMGVATLYVLYKDFSSFEFQNLQILGVGFLVSFIIGFLAVKMFLHIVSKYSFIPFGWYLIATAVIFYAVL